MVVQDSSSFCRSKSCLYQQQDFTDGKSYGNSDGIDDDESNGMEFFDDFDFVVGDNSNSATTDGSSNSNTGDTSTTDNSSSTSSLETEGQTLGETTMPSGMSVLQQRFQKLALTEQVNRQQISDNWKEGYWSVWGCSLDPSTEDTTQKTVVTSVRLVHSSTTENDDDDDDATLLIVGRSDGSICWLQMETLSLPSSSSSPSDNDPKSSIESRSVTTYFENKLVAKATEDGGMVVNTSLQRREGNDDDNGNYNDAMNDTGININSPGDVPPFDILAQIQTSTSDSNADVTAAAIVDMLPLPAAKVLWTISLGAPNVIQGWNLSPDSDTGFLLPSSSSGNNGGGQQSSKIGMKTIHTSPIVAMKVVPVPQVGANTQLVVSVSTNGQVVVWEVTPGDDQDECSSSIRIRLDTNILQQQWEEEYYDENDSILSMDVDDQHLYLGSRGGRIYIFSLAEIKGQHFATSDTSSSANPTTSLQLLKSFIGFTSRDPGVSTLLAAGPGSLGANNGTGNTNTNRPPTKSLIAGNMAGGLKQWELIPAGKGRLEYWPRMASQKLPGGKPHVYETSDYSHYDDDDDEGDASFSPAIRGLVCIQQVLLAATAQDLTFWDSTTGKALYDMQGLDFALHDTTTHAHAQYQRTTHHLRPNLIAVKNSVLVTNGMENFVCVHDFAMNRVTSENAQDFLELDDNVGIEDDDDYDDDEANRDDL